MMFSTFVGSIGVIARLPLHFSRSRRFAASSWGLENVFVSGIIFPHLFLTDFLKTPKAGLAAFRSNSGGVDLEDKQDLLRFATIGAVHLIFRIEDYRVRVGKEQKPPGGVPLPRTTKSYTHGRMSPRVRFPSFAHSSLFP
jgi:hypothetical protein